MILHEINYDKHRNYRRLFASEIEINNDNYLMYIVFIYGLYILLNFARNFYPEKVKGLYKQSNFTYLKMLRFMMHNPLSSIFILRRDRVSPYIFNSISFYKELSYPGYCQIRLLQISNMREGINYQLSDLLV